jgi:5-methylcytosine-specific restriction endonuclease McrA
MPIRPENKGRYPKDWKQISYRIRFERAGGLCEVCGAAHGQPHPLTGSTVVLTVAHLDHTPENCADDNLKAMCQKCHNGYDARTRAAGIRERKRDPAQLSLL